MKKLILVIMAVLMVNFVKGQFHQYNSDLTWKPLGTLPDNLQITTLTTDGSMLYAASNSPTFSDGIIKLYSSTNGIAWNEVSSPFEDYSLFYHFYAMDNVLFASVADNSVIPVLIKSEDNGNTWNVSQNGMITNSTTQYLISSDNDVILASTFTVVDNKFVPRIYKSDDQAISWFELSLSGIPSSSNSLFVCMAYTGSDFITVYIDIENTISGIYKSLDGANWSFVSSPPSEFLPLDITINEMGIWYLSGTNVNSLRGEIYVSEDEGVTWNPITTQGINEYGYSFTAIEFFNNELFLSTSLEDVSSGFKVFTSGSNKLTQTITFNSFENSTYGDVALTLGASATSNLAIEYSSSQPAVATVINNTLVISGAGNAVITATQKGNDLFEAAEEVERVITVEKALLIAEVKDASKKYGQPNPDFGLIYEGFVNGENSEALDLAPMPSSDVTSNTSVGKYEIFVEPGLDNNYQISYKSGVLTIDKTVLNVSVINQERYFGLPNPEFTLNYSGFVNNESIEVIDILPQPSTTAKVFSDPGEYEVNISGGMDNNYSFSYTPGLLTVLEQTITGNFENENDKIRVYPNPTNGILTINGSQSSQLFTHFAITDLSGKTLYIGPLNKEIVINLSGLRRGIYLLKIFGNNRVEILKIFKK